MWPTARATLLLEINPGLTVGGYPDMWTEFTVNNFGGATGGFGGVFPGGGR